jgi:hypothetical protein
MTLSMLFLRLPKDGVAFAQDGHAHSFPQDQQTQSNFDQAIVVLRKLLWSCQKAKSQKFSEVFHEFLQHAKPQLCSTY